MNGLGQIRGIELETGIRLEQFPMEEIGRVQRSCYALDTDGNIIAPSLSNAGLSRFPVSVLNLTVLRELRLFQNETGPGAGSPKAVLGSVCEC